MTKEQLAQIIYESLKEVDDGQGWIGKFEGAYGTYTTIDGQLDLTKLADIVLKAIAP